MLVGNTRTFQSGRGFTMTTQQAKRRPLARIIALTLALSAPLMASAQTPIRLAKGSLSGCTAGR